MKKYIIILAVALFTVSACNKIELLDKPIIETLDNGDVSYTFTAVIADNVSEVEEDGTKATVSRGGEYTWAEGDALRFYKNDGTYANASVTRVVGSTATITVTTGARADFVSAIYPASAAVAKDQISFNARGPIVVAEVFDGGTLTFHHVGSLINIKFTGISANDDIKSLVFTPSSAFSYNGTFTFSGDHKPTLTATGSTPRIVVPASKADNNSDITVCVPSVNLAGFSAALNNDEDGNGRNLFKKSTATAHNLYDAEGPVLMNMQKVAYEAPSKYYVTTVSTSGYWDRTDVRMIQTGANTYGVQMNCDGSSNVYIYDNYNVGNHLNGYLNKGSVGDGRFYNITWNTSTSSGGPAYVSATRDYPFNHGDYPVGVNGMALSGSFNSWSYSTNLFTYNTNMSWVCEGLVIASAGSYIFKIRKAQSDWAYDAGVNTGLGSSLYGSLKGDNDNASVTLEAGTYNVYLNATSDWYYNIMFEKQ